MRISLIALKRKKADPIYSWQFIFLCMSSLLFSASFNMLIPELPNYITNLGGAEYKGLIIALFTLTAGISRPFSGKLTDTIGRVPIMAFGSIVCFICGFLYPILSSVAGFLFLRLIHGFSTGFKPTATAAYIADIIPKDRWGEALGLHGISFSIGMAIGPALGSTIVLYSDINMLFYCSSLFALLSIVILFNMKETLQNKKKFQLQHLRINMGDIYYSAVLPAAIVTCMTYVAYGALLTVIPDWSTHLGIQNKGLFFVLFTIASIFVRFLAGKTSDKKGRVYVIKLGLTIMICSLLVMTFIPSFNGFCIASILYGLGTGILSPALNAWTIDFSAPAYRGRAMAMMYIALEIGIGSGAFFAGLYYQDALSMVPSILFASAIIAIGCLIYMLIKHKSLSD
jgi:MFS family permease